MSQVGVLVRKVVRRQYFYGWNIVGVSFLASLSHSAQISSILGVFIKPMGKDLGFSRGAIAGVQTATRAGESVLAPFLGPRVDRGWGRRMMVIGSIIAGLGFIALSQVQELWQLYAIKAGVIAIGLAGYGFLVTHVTMMKWFNKKRGRAVAIADMGASLGGVVLVPMLAWVVSTWGWRYGWAAVGILVLLLVPIPAAIFMRRQPEDMGLRPDGEPPLPGETSPSAPQISLGARKGMPAGEDYWTRGEAMRTRTFWLLIAAFGTGQIFMMAINLHLIPYLEDKGYALSLAALAISIRSFVSMISNLFWGLAVERVEARYLASVKFLMYAVGMAILWLFPASFTNVLLAVAIYGFAQGGTGILTEVLFAKYYGRLALGEIRGAAFPFFGGMGAGAPLVVGVIFDLTGSYSGAFAAIIAGVILASGLVLLCTAPRRRASLI